jgi:hypothetical protein
MGPFGRRDLKGVMGFLECYIHSFRASTKFLVLVDFAISYVVPTRWKMEIMTSLVLHYKIKKSRNLWCLRKLIYCKGEKHLESYYNV